MKKLDLASCAAKYALPLYLVVSALIYGFVYSNAPIALEPTAGYDDGLYLKLGRYLAYGQWLGPFDQTTLIKGPGYPAFLAAANWLAMPVTFAQGLLNAGSMIFVALICRLFIKSRIIIAVLFSLLLWHPAPLSAQLLRIVRENIYSLQVLIVLIAFSWLMLGADTRCARLGYGALSGLVLGWLWLTREEGIWMVSAIAVVVAVAFVDAVRNQRHRQFASAIVIVAAGFAAPIIVFSAINLHVYKKFIAVDFKESNFQRALGAIQGVRVGAPRAFVSVTREARRRIYEVSPAFATLKAELEGISGQGWESAGCRTQKAVCGEIGAAWFLFALRDAAAIAGNYQSPQKASDFFGRVADEISSACAHGELRCSPLLFNEMSFYSWEQLAEFPAPLIQKLKLLLMWEHLTPEPGASTGDPEEFAAALSFLHYPRHTRPVELPDFSYRTVIGWYHKSGDAWLSAAAVEPNFLRPLKIERVPSPDVALQRGDPKAVSQRFLIKFVCGSPCMVRFSASDGAIADISLEKLSGMPASFGLGQGTVMLERVSSRDDPRYALTIPHKLSDNVRDLVLRSYNILFFPVLALGLVAFIATSLRYRWQAFANICYVIALASLALVAGRVFLLVLIDLTSFPALSIKYIAPAYFPLVCFAVMSIAAWLQLSGRLGKAPATSHL